MHASVSIKNLAWTHKSIWRENDEAVYAKKFASILWLVALQTKEDEEKRESVGKQVIEVVYYVCVSKASSFHNLIQPLYGDAKLYREITAKVFISLHQTNTGAEKDGWYPLKLTSRLKFSFKIFYISCTCWKSVRSCRS